MPPNGSKIRRGEAPQGGVACENPLLDRKQPTSLSEYAHTFASSSIDRVLSLSPSMRRPVGVKWFLCRSCLSLVSSQPSYQLSPPFHPHSSMSEFFRSVQVGCSRFSRCCHLIVDLPSHPRWKLGQAINAVTGTRRLGFVLPIGSTTRLPVAWPDCYCAAVHKPPHLPTGDAATPLTFERWPRWLVSFRFSLHARPTSGPSVAGRYRLQTAPECGVHPAPAASADTDLLPC